MEMLQQNLPYNYHKLTKILLKMKDRKVKQVLSGGGYQSEDIMKW
jgi:hypothetical protein